MKLSYFALALSCGLLLGGCASTGSSTGQQAKKGSVQTVRTTAYTHSERDHRRYGKRNAVGGTLSSGGVRSAAADWSRFPLGTKFKVLETGEICRIDDYGSALVGTNTIDLYKPSRSEMNRWGVRNVHIKILEWGCEEKSLEVLEERTRYRHVRQMVDQLRRQDQG